MERRGKAEGECPRDWLGLSLAAARATTQMPTTLDSTSLSLSLVRRTIDGLVLMTRLSFSQVDLGE